MKVKPNSEEMLVCKQFSGDITQLSTSVEAFMFSLSQVSCINDRLKCLEIKQKFDNNFFTILDKVELMNNAVFSGLRQNQTLHMILAMVVQIGNYLNHGTPKGNSQGFKISLLTNLSSIKSINSVQDGSKKAKLVSLLDFILE
jgi:dishevelled associated activator of morphogenesis